MSHNFTRNKKINEIISISKFGQRQSRNVDTLYQETSNGFIINWTPSYSAGILIRPTGATINVAETHFTGGSGGGGPTAFLPKNWYWRTYSGTASWVPIEF